MQTAPLRSLILTILIMIPLLGLTAQSNLTARDSESLSSIDIQFGEPEIRRLELSYDKQGRLEIMSDSHTDGGSYWRFTYEEGDQPGSLEIYHGEDSYSNEVLTFQYGAEGLEYALLQAMDFMGEELYAYDEEQRISRISWNYSDMEGEQLYGYKAGSLRKVIQTIVYEYEGESESSWVFFRDDTGRVERIMLRTDNDYFGENSEGEHVFHYDETGRLSLLTYSESEEVLESQTFLYDETGRLETLEGMDRGTSYKLVFNYSPGRAHNPFRQYFLYYDPVAESLPEAVLDGYLLYYVLTKY